MTRHLIIGALVASLMAEAAHADTLREALNSTYATNPTLNAQRESLKSTDAGVAIARAGGRPTIIGNVGVTRDLTRSGRFDVGTGKGPFMTSSVDLAVPIFQGGTVRNNIKASKERVEAGRATLRAVEGDVFTEAVAAYMDVMRDRASVELNANNVKVLETNLQATSDRFEIGDVTRTDVAQSEARLSLARSRLLLAQGRLTGMPAKRAKRLIVLDHIAGSFEPGTRYDEREVNEILVAFHPDFAMLRRYLVDEGFLSRDHGVYWRSGGTVDV